MECLDIISIFSLLILLFIALFNLLLITKSLKLANFGNVINQLYIILGLLVILI